jgi:hypothetical protein
MANETCRYADMNRLPLASHEVGQLMTITKGSTHQVTTTETAAQEDLGTILPTRQETPMTLDTF